MQCLDRFPRTRAWEQAFVSEPASISNSLFNANTISQPEQAVLDIRGVCVCVCGSVRFLCVRQVHLCG